MKKHWWKALSVVVLLYVFGVGLLVPLKPGILEVSSSNARAGEEVTFEVKGYNSFYEKGKNGLRAWLKLDAKNALAAKEIKVKNDRELSLTFSIPKYLPTAKRVKEFSLILDNEVDGASVFPSALFVTQDTIAPTQAGPIWHVHPISELHEKTGMTFPFRNILAETIRNTYFHVPLWFAMFIIFTVAMVNSVHYLRKGIEIHDIKAMSLTRVGILFGLMGLATGSIWARFTWGAFWSFDVKQNMTVIALLIYLAYFVLRNSFEDPEKKARISAVYNIFAFASLVPLLFVIPRLTDSLHPGSGGNPALGGEDLDNTMRMVFYPAIIGWTLLGLWIADLYFRTQRLKERVSDY